MSRLHFLQPSEIRRHRRLWLLGANLVALTILVAVLRGGGDDGVEAGSGESTPAAEPFGPVDLAVPDADASPSEGTPELRAPELQAPPGAGALASDPASAPAEDASTGGAAPGAKAAGEAASGDDVAERPRSAALAQAIEREIARAVGRAREGSKGRVHGANTTVAVHVRDLEGGVLVARQASRALRPASNLKLLTCATALVLLGPDAHFETPFEAAGPIAEGVLRGDLVARAGGDPLYRDGGDGGIETWIEPLARELHEAGIERVTGALVLDEGTFPEPAPGPAWPDEREHWQEYCALAGGFSANAGCITATISPGPVGGSATVRVRPREHGLERKGAVTTGPRRSSLSVAVEARPRGLTVRGKIPADVPTYAPRFAAPDPVELFGHAVVGELARHGVVVEGGHRRERGVPDGPGGSVVARLRSPVDDTLAPILRDSNNSVADQLFLATAHLVGLPGSRAGGFDATRRALDRLGVPTDGLAQVDGSGLSRDNRVSAEQLTALLAAMRREAGASADLFLDALPVAGKSGSLSGRMRSGPASGRVRAKTGFIGGTSGLSGFVETAAGETLVFSILVDYPVFSGLNTSAWKPMQDGICAVIAAWEGDGR